MQKILEISKNFLMNFSILSRNILENSKEIILEECENWKFLENSLYIVENSEKFLVIFFSFSRKFRDSDYGKLFYSKKTFPDNVLSFDSIFQPFQAFAKRDNCSRIAKVFQKFQKIKTVAHFCFRNAKNSRKFLEKIFKNLPKNAKFLEILENSFFIQTYEMFQENF